MFEIVKAMHSKGFIHRDLKPANFCMGLGHKQEQLYLIDFGISRRYIDPSTNQHFEPNESGGFISLDDEPDDDDDRPRLIDSVFSSARIQIGGYEGSRRDDAFSIIFMISYFGAGYLPWKGSIEVKDLDEEQEYNMVKIK